ncbi:DedA family protein [Intrasporangium flavum]|uniref:DedA family protein n=1 Tax=Intrasporangium flavum TaxID=1428657 RepID=UPI0009F9999B|nr:VTT domain-containing protein [Intrasporangium flavum]
MLDAIAALPFWQAFLALFASAMVRSNGTYWVGRGAVNGWRRYRGTHRELTSRAEAWLSRLGPVAVVLSYLTVGFQTAVHLTAGVMRMPLRWYVPAAVVGSVVWATLYATVGLAVVEAWIAAEAGSVWAAAGLGAFVAAVVATLVVRRRRRAAGEPPVVGPLAGEPGAVEPGAVEGTGATRVTDTP